MLGIIVLNFGYLMSPKMVSAAPLTVLSDTVSNLTASTVANHTIVFTTPTGITAGQTLTLTFNNSTSTTGVLYTDVNFKDAGSSLPLAASPSGATWGFNNASPVLTFTSGTGTIAAGHVITILIGTNATSPTGVNQITNGAAGTTTIRIAGTFADTGAISMAIISNGVVALSAEVLASLTFTISTNSIWFGNLRTTGSSCWAQNTNPGYVACPTVAEAEAFNMTAGTNGSTGYSISVQGPTLTSGANTIAALGSSTAPSIGTEQFGIRMNNSGGIGTVTAPYATAGQYAYTATSTTPAQVASATGPSATTTYSVRYMANISAITKAGSYTTAHTYIATGNY